MDIVYILKSLKSSKYYTGSTCEIERRLDDHNKGRGSAFTNIHKPWELVCYRKCDNIEQARKIEKLIKSYKGGSAFKKIIDGEVAEWSKAPHC